MQSRPQRRDFIVLLLMVSMMFVFCRQDPGAQSQGCKQPPIHLSHLGAIVRGDTTQPELALIFTGGDYSDGGNTIRTVLQKKQILAGFFFTGQFYRQPQNTALIRGLIADGHYLGPHSDQHLLYCDWSNRDSLLVNREEFFADLDANYAAMAIFGIERNKASVFIPPYEWYNATIADWAKDAGAVLINFTPGTLSHADYTTPEMTSYRSSAEILNSIYCHEKKSPSGLNGFILLMHIGTAPQRTDKLYNHLSSLIDALGKSGYRFTRIDRMLPYESIVPKNCAHFHLSSQCRRRALFSPTPGSRAFGKGTGSFTGHSRPAWAVVASDPFQSTGACGLGKNR